LPTREAGPAPAFFQSNPSNRSAVAAFRVIVTAALPLEHQLSAAKANLRSLQEKARLARAQLTWCEKSMVEAEKRIAELERAMAQQTVLDPTKPDGP
jgi:hypothetical protein